MNMAVYYSGIHEKSHQLKPLPLNPLKSSFCVFSLAFSSCGEQIIGGGRYYNKYIVFIAYHYLHIFSDGCLYIYDLALNRRTLRCPVSVGISTFLHIQIILLMNQIHLSISI